MNRSQPVTGRDVNTSEVETSSVQTKAETWENRFMWSLGIIMMGALAFLIAGSLVLAIPSHLMLLRIIIVSLLSLFVLLGIAGVIVSGLFWLVYNIRTG